MENFIRYGVHKKKKLLLDATKAYDGIVFPANILLYQYKATPGVVIFLRKKYFIDPMSYLLGEDFEGFKKVIEGSSGKFKPSFDKLLIGHGLDPQVLLKLTSKQIKNEFINNKIFLRKFVDSCIAFQKKTIRAAINETPDLTADIMEEIEGLLDPIALVPPYFYIDQNNFEETLALNKEIIGYCVQTYPNDKFNPLIYINKAYLKRPESVDTLIATYYINAISGFVLWIEDFSESAHATKESVKAIAKLVHGLSTLGENITFLHGGYFGMLFKYFGATAICHGLGYGEVRSGLSSSKGGGPPPVRYYLKDLHTFITLDRALELLRARPELICDCPICKKVIGADPENIINYTGQDDLADLHYLYVRAKEKDFINAATLDVAIGDLDFTLELYNDLDQVTRKVTDKKGKTYEEQIVSPEYLAVWKDALVEANQELQGTNAPEPDL